MNRSHPRGLLAAVLLGLFSAGAAADDLWDRALDVAEANQDWFAASIVIELQQLNSRGRLVDGGTTAVSRSVSGSGEITESVTRSGSSPPDHQNLLAGGLGLPLALRAGDGALGVFERARQDDLDLERQPGTEILPGSVETAVYRFSQPSADGSTVRGRVWVDVASAVPLRVETSPDQPPEPLVSATTVLHFQPFADSWYPVRMEITGLARVMVVEREIQTTVIVSDYTRYLP